MRAHAWKIQAEIRRDAHVSRIPSAEVERSL